VVGLPWCSCDADGIDPSDDEADRKPSAAELSGQASTNNIMVPVSPSLAPQDHTSVWARASRCGSGTTVVDQLQHALRATRVQEHGTRLTHAFSPIGDALQQRQVT